MTNLEAHSSGYNDTTAFQYTTTASTTEEPVSRIEIPYAIAGSYAIMMSMCLILCFCYGQVKTISIYGKSKDSLKAVCSPEGFKGKGSTRFTVAVLVLICLLLGFSSSASGCIDQFMFSYAVDSELNFSKDEASALDATYKSVKIISRIICIIVSKWVTADWILGVSATFYTIFYACMTFLGTKKKSYLWAFACSYNFFSAPIWPNTNIFSFRYITYSALVVGFMQVCSSTMVFFTQWLSGYVYDMYSPEAFIYVGFSLAIVMYCIWISLQTLVSCQKSRANIARQTSDVWTVTSKDNYINVLTQTTNL